MFRPIILLTGQPILFTWSIKRRRITFTYTRFLKTYSLAGVSKTMALCLCIKEPSYFLIPYSSMLTDLDMFSHRRLLRLAQSSLYWFVLYNFGVLLGFYFSCSGKISVGGNSRTRTMLKSYGYKSTSLVTTQTTNTSSIINTVTGCLGLLLIFLLRRLIVIGLLSKMRLEGIVLLLLKKPSYYTSTVSSVFAVVHPYTVSLFGNILKQSSLSFYIFYF